MHREIPQKLNLLLSLFLISLHLYVFYLFPLFHLQEGGYLIYLIPFTALLTPQFWALIHDSGHLVLFKSRKLNNLFGRLMSILFGSNFKLLQFGHNIHHGFNRTEVDCTDLFDKNSVSRVGANLVYYSKIFFSLYLGEVLMPFLFLLPKRVILKTADMLLLGKGPHHARIHDQVTQHLLTRKNLYTIRVDTVILALHFGAIFSLFGTHWYILAAFFGLRAFMVSFFDNIYHYATPKERDYSYNLSLPTLLSRGLLNFNYHQVHHAYPNVSWINLPKVFEEGEFRFDKAYGRAMANQLNGPIYI